MSRRCRRVDSAPRCVSSSCCVVVNRMGPTLRLLEGRRPHAVGLGQAVTNESSTLLVYGRRLPRRPAFEDQRDRLFDESLGTHDQRFRYSEATFRPVRATHRIGQHLVEVLAPVGVFRHGASDLQELGYTRAAESPSSGTWTVTRPWLSAPSAPARTRAGSVAGSRGCS